MSESHSVLTCEPMFELNKVYYYNVHCDYQEMNLNGFYRLLQFYIQYCTKNLLILLLVIYIVKVMYSEDKRPL